MPIEYLKPPLWLLEQEGLSAAQFSEDGTVLLNCRLNAHNAQVNDTGNGPVYKGLDINLKRQPNWPETRKRLADEGYI